MHESLKFWANWTARAHFRRKVIRVLRQKIAMESPVQGKGFIMYDT